MTSLATIQVGLSWQKARPSGLNRVFAELVRRLPGEGVAVQGIVAGTPDVERESMGLVHAFARADIAMWRRMLAARSAVRRLAAANPEALLVSHFAPYGQSVLAVPGARRIVVHFHGPWSLESKAEGHGPLSVALRGMIEGRVYRRASACIVLSRAFGDLLHAEFGIPRSRIHVIPGGADLTRFAALPSRAEARQRLGWPVEAPAVLCVRRLVRRTGVDQLLEATKLLRARIPAVRVLIAGQGPETDALKERARALDLGETVRFLGGLSEEELPLVFRAADLSVVPSVALEGFGLIVPESLAAGTPVLVTPVGGLPETVEELSRELILDAATPRAIADGIAGALLGSRVVPDAAACSAYARGRYDWAVVARRTAELYRKVAAMPVAQRA
jgi:glycosyltransferase involved in cell wall biosynthesis